jgi:hypothetical protein
MIHGRAEDKEEGKWALNQVSSRADEEKQM